MISLKQKLSVVFLLLLPFSAFGAVSLGDPTISSVQTSFGKLEGSTQGGTTLYIKGVNFGASPTQNKVSVGSFPCEFENGGVMEGLLKCKTTKAYGETKYWHHRIKVQVQGKTTAQSSQRFAARDHQTPYVGEIEPKSIIGGQRVSIHGWHRITDLGDGEPNTGQVQRITIGSTLCSRAGIVQSSFRNIWSYGNIKCDSYQYQQAGEYEFKELVNRGYANYRINTRETSFFTKNSYMERILPKIQSISAHKGGNQGHRITVKGQGFSSQVANYACKAAGEICTITQASSKEITVEIPPQDILNTDFDKLAQEAADPFVQKLGYTKGIGAKLVTYNRNREWRSSAEEWWNLVHGQNKMIKLDEGYVTEIGFHDFPAHHLHHVFGYFHAPATGMYIFSCTVDDVMIVKMSKFKNNANPDNFFTLLKHEKWTGSRFNPYLRKDEIHAVKEQHLEQGLYYFEVVAINTGGPGHYRVMVEMPPIFTQNPVNKAWKIEELTIQPQITEPQILEVKVYGQSGKFSLYYFHGSRVRRAEWSVGVDAENFRKNLWRLPNIWNYNPTVQMKTLDIDGNETDEKCKIEGYLYIIRINNYRPLTDPPFGNASSVVPTENKAKDIIITKTQEHSAPLSGSFKMEIDSVKLKYRDSESFNYNERDWKIESAIESYYENKEIKVYFGYSIRPEDIIRYYIYYNGIEDPKPLTIDLSNLHGGKTGTTPVYQMKTLREYSASRPFYFKIPADFLFLASDKPALTISVNNIPAFCENCDYEIDPTLTPKLTSASLTGNNLFTSLNSNTSVNLQDISIQLEGVECEVQGTTENPECAFPTNADSSPQLPAGTQSPAVHLAPVGYAAGSFQTQVSTSLSVTSMTPAQSSFGGNIVGKLVGTGFPVNLASKGDLMITLCGEQVTDYVSIQNQQINFIIPSVDICSNGVYEVSYNGDTASIPFQYNSSIGPTVSSLSLTSSSPILKKQLTITGSGFTYEAYTKVFLLNQNGTQIYQLNVLHVDSTTVRCMLGGGRTGIYDVIVVTDGVGASQVSAVTQFQYKIVVTGLSRNQGSMGGGYSLVVTGYNFSPGEKANNVLIGGQFCSIESVTQTEITCTVAAMGPEHTPGSDLEVVVLGRIRERSICQTQCTFSYNQSATAVVTPPQNRDYWPGNVVSLKGSGLSGGVVSVGGVEVTPTTANDTDIEFAYPYLEVGSHFIQIKVGQAFAFPRIRTSTFIWPRYLKRRSGSPEGHRTSVRTYGFPSDPSKIEAYWKCEDKYLQVLEPSPKQFTIEIPPKGNHAYCDLRVEAGGKSKQWRYTYETSSSNIPNISISETSPLVYNVTLHTLSYYYYNFIEFVLLDANSQLTSTVYNMQIIKINNMELSITPENGYLGVGTYAVKAHTEKYGYAVSSPQTITITAATLPSHIGTVSSSFAGGKTFTITGAGFHTESIQNNEVLICDQKATVIQASQTSLEVEIPSLVNNVIQAVYGLSSEQVVKGEVFSDSNYGSRAFDSFKGSVYSSENPSCYVGVDFGINTIVDVTQIRYIPNPDWAIASEKLHGAVFEGSNDGSLWIPIFNIDANSVHSGWNHLKKVGSFSHQYRYVRFSHDSTSRCEMAEIEITGYKLNTLPVTSTSGYFCDVSVTHFYHTISSIVQYTHSETAVISAIDPPYGPSVGGTTVHLTGQNIGAAAYIQIDNHPCVVTTHNATDIFCVTSLRPNPPAQGNSMKIFSDGNQVPLATQPFLYIDRWSDEATWGGQAPPIEGDTVIVEKGKTLLVDISPPVLYTVIVEGNIIFADERDLQFEAHYFLILNGGFEAGTEEDPFQHNLKITMHGDYYDKHLPSFGNKGIGCLNCKFNMHGRKRQITWTQVKDTIEAGDTTFEVLNSVDWVPGERIVIASTSFDRDQAEEKTITFVSFDGKTIIVTEPFQHRHFAAVETYNGTDVAMRAEVGLLSRNIIMQGDSNSEDKKYGSHLMLTGSEADGLVGKISYTQFTHCGQPAVIGRYCMHFHMAGQVPESYVIGNSVHESFARVLTIHGTHMLLVEKNVGYRVQGHNIFLEDGIETHNIIQDNLMINSISSLLMLQSDFSVSSYWITNPYNTVRRNHAGGSDFYGFWYDIKQNPDGPSATSDICPTGMRLGESKDNVAHSNGRFGARIDTLSAREFPCRKTKNQHLIDPYSENQAYHSVFDNYTVWRNSEVGFICGQLGYTTVRDIKAVDNIKAGMQIHKTNFTKEPVVFEENVIVGFSRGNAPENIDDTYKNTRGIIASRTDGLIVSNMKFINFGLTMTPLQSCSQCFHYKLWVTGGKTTHFEIIYYENITGKYIFWENWRREMFIDMDGTLLKPLSEGHSLSVINATLTPDRPTLHLDDCHVLGGQIWDHSVICEGSAILRSILITNMNPWNFFKAAKIKVTRLDTPKEEISGRLEDEYSIEDEVKIMSGDIPNSWAMPFALGYYYHIHWRHGLDFTHMSIAPSSLFNENEAGVVLRFNYTDARQLFEIGKWFEGQLQAPLLEDKLTVISPADCQNGDYHNDQANQYLFICVSGKKKYLREWVDVKGFRCMQNCPKQNNTAGTERQSEYRLWSDPANWEGGLIPQQGSNVTIKYEWKMKMDINPPKLQFLDVRGILQFDDTADRKIQAQYIWVTQGKIIIGSESQPFQHKADIILHGDKDDPYMVLDPGASGNKMLAVTGGLQFYGIVPNVTRTRLTSIAAAGATSIEVENQTDWSVGDKIAIAPSYSGRTEYEEVEITQISGKVIHFTPALQYEHYGNSNITIDNDFGKMDARSAVGHLNRNIKISSFDENIRWGCRVQIYGYYEYYNDGTAPIFKNGYAKLVGVQIDRCGQYDTSYAALNVERVGSNLDYPNEEHTVVSGSSIHGCQGYCANLQKISNVTFSNNVFFEAEKFLVYVGKVVRNYHFVDNLLIGAHKRDITEVHFVDDVACYEQFVAIDYHKNPNVSVTGNLAQGSEGEGFVFPATSCNRLSSYPFVGNTAGSCLVAFMYERLQGQDCLAVSGAIGYASKVGLNANYPGRHTKVIYENMIFADNQRGITLRYAHETDDNTFEFRNSYIAGYSRKDCPDCYSETKLSYCQNGYAVRMFSATISGQTFPLVKDPLNHDVICTKESFDFKAFVINVTFENYLHTNSDIPYCSNMAVFKRHPGASDGTASHHLTKTKCVNCQKEAWAKFEKPNEGWRGWFGGCGEFDCTGPNNYFIFDQDGEFTGEISQLLANNSHIGQGEASCDHIEEINGYWCHIDNLAIMEFESIAPDFNKRTVWPVDVSYDGGNWVNVINAWKQWVWVGPEPQNLRQARFWAALLLHKTYNITFASSPPTDMIFQIQSRMQPSGNPNDWAIIRIYYPSPNSVEIKVSDTSKFDSLVKPFPIYNGTAKNLTQHVDECGANTFHFENGTIEFVVNGKNKCQVRVRLSSFVQLSSEISIPMNEFYSDDGETSFISNICAFLEIDTDRMKIVGVSESGSNTVVESVIQTPAPPISESTTTSSDPAAEQAELEEIEEKLSQDKVSSSGKGLPYKVSVKKVKIYNADGTVYEENLEDTVDVKAKNRKIILILVLSIVLPLVVIGLVIGIVCWRKRKETQSDEHRRNELGTQSAQTNIITQDNIMGTMQDKFSDQIPAV